VNEVNSIKHNQSLSRIRTRLRGCKMNKKKMSKHESRLHRELGHDDEERVPKLDTYLDRELALAWVYQ
jgi:hypothetical protein